jgi:hypothetical protein
MVAGECGGPLSDGLTIELRGTNFLGRDSAGNVHAAIVLRKRDWNIVRPSFAVVNRSRASPSMLDHCIRCRFHPVSPQPDIRPLHLSNVGSNENGQSKRVRRSLTETQMAS